MSRSHHFASATSLMQHARPTGAAYDGRSDDSNNGPAANGSGIQNEPFRHDETGAAGHHANIAQYNPAVRMQQQQQQQQQPSLNRRYVYDARAPKDHPPGSRPNQLAQANYDDARTVNTYPPAAYQDPQAYGVQASEGHHQHRAIPNQITGRDAPYQNYTETNSSVPKGTFLNYPRHFFAGGKIPKEPAKAALLWRWRKARAHSNAAADAEPDGDAMIEEMKDIRRSLREAVKDAYHAGVVEKCASEDVTFYQTRQLPKNQSDVMKVLGTLPNSITNHVIVWNVFHTFEYGWTGQVIDDWFKVEKMNLLDEVPSETSGEGDNGGGGGGGGGANGAEGDDDDATKAPGRHYSAHRGGFSPIAVIAKTGVTRSYMDHLWRTQGWKISAKGAPGTKATEAGIVVMHQNKQYTSFLVSGGTRKKELAWLVEKGGGDMPTVRKSKNEAPVLNLTAYFDLDVAAESLNKLIDEGERFNKQSLLDFLESARVSVNRDTHLGRVVAQGKPSDASKSLSTVTQEMAQSATVAAGKENNVVSQEGLFVQESYQQRDSHFEIGAFFPLADSLTDSLTDPLLHLGSSPMSFQEQNSAAGNRVSACSVSDAARNGEAGINSDDDEDDEDVLYARKAPAAAPARGATSGQMRASTNTATLQGNAAAQARGATSGQMRATTNTATVQGTEEFLRARYGVVISDRSTQAPRHALGAADGTHRQEPHRPPVADRRSREMASISVSSKAKSSQKEQPMATGAGLNNSPGKNGSGDDDGTNNSGGKRKTPPRVTKSTNGSAKKNKNKEVDASPIREEDLEEECHHEDSSKFKQDDNGSYYSTEYLAKHAHSNKRCVGKDCLVEFGKNYKVGPNKIVYLCENAKKQYHSCKFALCKTCYNKKFLADDSRRSRSLRTRKK